MALGELANPGIASGVLTGDVLDKLKAADTERFVKRYDTKITSNTNQQKDMTELKSKISAVKSSLMDLADSGSFSKRSVSQSGDKDTAKLDVTSGVALASMDIEIKRLAERDVYQSKGIKDKNEAILEGTNTPKGDATFTISLGKKSWEINLDEASTYSDLVDQVISKTEGKIQAKLLNTGEPGQPYRLSLSAKDSGTDNTIGFFAGKKTTDGKGNVVYKESDGANALLDKLGWAPDKSTINHSEGYTVEGMAGKKEAVGTVGVSGATTITGADFAFTLVGRTDSYVINVKQNDTFDNIIDEINKKTKGEYEASIDNSGHFTIQAKGGNNEVKIIDGAPKMVPDPDDKTGKTMMKVPGVYETNASATDFLNQIGFKLDKSSSTSLNTYGISDQSLHMSSASNAVFSYDGIEMTRQSNTVKDLGVGMTLTLEKKGKVHFEITQDAGDIAKSMEDFVSSYNDLILNLNAATDYDAKNKTMGSLQGVSEINSIENELTQILFGTTKQVEGTEIDENGNEKKTQVVLSMASFGLELNKNGTLKLDQGKFEDQLNKDMKAAEDFFAGFTSWSKVSLDSDPKLMNSFGNKKDSVLLDTADYTFKRGDMKITYGDSVIDLFEDKDGNNFVLTGKNEQERMANLVKHINSFNIDGLNAKMVKINYQGKPTYLLKIEGEGGEDLSITGKDNILKSFGLQAGKSISEMEDQTGVFAKLKTKLSELTGKGGAVSTYSDYLTREGKDLKTDRKQEMDRIDAKYEAMTVKWNAYEQVLAKLQGQQSAVVSAINAMNNQGS